MGSVVPKYKELGQRLVEKSIERKPKAKHFWTPSMLYDGGGVSLVFSKLFIDGNRWFWTTKVKCENSLEENFLWHLGRRTFLISVGWLLPAWLQFLFSASFCLKSWGFDQRVFLCICRTSCLWDNTFSPNILGCQNVLKWCVFFL